MLNVYGAGMAGLLCAHILKHRSPVVHELQPSLPDNHAALLRFRTNAVSEATGIPFRKVRVQKALWDGKRLRTTTALHHNNQYSLKVTGRASGRSVLDLAPAERFIAPPDFLKRLAEGVNIVYGAGLTAPAPGISTIPLPALAALLGVALPISFEARKIWTKTFTIEAPEVDLFQTVYFPEPEIPLYRASITGNRFTMEYSSEPKAGDVKGFKPLWDRPHHVLEVAFGIRLPRITLEGTKSQKFGKLLPVDDEIRRSFILYATEKHGLYSAGRFATWRQILLDDVVKDAHVINRMMGQVDRYSLLKELRQQ